jgi:hypothetical protein
MFENIRLAMEDDLNICSGWSYVAMRMVEGAEWQWRMMIGGDDSCRGY